MYYENLINSAGTSYRRVAVRVVGGDWRWRGTGWFGHGCTSSGGNVMLITLFAKLKPSNQFYKIHRQTTLHNNLLCAHVLEVFWKMLTTGYLRVNQELGGWRFLSSCHIYNFVPYGHEYLTILLSITKPTQPLSCRHFYGLNYCLWYYCLHFWSDCF